MKKITRFFALAAMMLLCLSLTACGGSKLNLSDYLSITCSGVDGDGTAALHFDAAQMELDFAGVNNGIPAKKELEKMLSLAQFEFSIGWELDKNRGLSNGDKVTATITYDADIAKNAKVSVGSTTKIFTIEGLTEPIPVDPFEESIFGAGKTVDITLEGIDPFVTVSLRNNASGDDPIRYVSYETDCGWDTLKNGDVITVTAAMSAKAAKEGYVLTRTETTITVEGMDKYVTGADELNSEVLQKMADRAYNECVAKNDVNIYDGTHNFTPFDVNIDNIHVGSSSQLYVRKTMDNYDYSFLLIPVYKTLFKEDWYNWDTNEIESKTWENVVSYYLFSNLVVHADGTITYNDSYIDAHGSYTDNNVANNLYLNQFVSDYSTIEVHMP